MQNIKAFARLYGYVRWFHPSDEAQQIDWDRFACYGVKTVENAPGSEALKDSLLKLFLPIAPSMEICRGSDKHNFNRSKITPPDTMGFYPVYWQHYGVGIKQAAINVYSSLRINRINLRNHTNSCAVLKIIDASKYQGKSIELLFDGKSLEGSRGMVYFDAIKSIRPSEFLKYPIPIPFSINDWRKFRFRNFVDFDDNLILIGFTNETEDTLLIDNIKLVIKNEEIQDTIIFKCNLDNSKAAFSSNGFDAFKNLPFDVKIVGSSLRQDSCLAVAFDKDYKLFEQAPKADEIIDEQIHPDLTIRLPVVLMATDSHTFPAADKERLRLLQDQLNLWQSYLHKDLGSLVVIWNIIQHFFPYFDEVDVDWNKEFTVAINELLNEEDFESTLKKLMAKLKDGHIYIYPPACKNVYALPVKWQWIDGRLVIVEVYDENAGVFPGTVVKEIAGKKAENYFSDVELHIPAATEGALKNGSEFLTLLGTPGDSLPVEVIQVNGSRDKLNLKYTLHPNNNYNRSVNRTRYKFLRDNIVYLNLDQITMAEIDTLMPDLIKCKGIICDLRGYPNNNHELLNHLLTLNDTVDNWFKIPQLIYPNQKNICFDGIGWNTVPREPHIDAPVIFITDSRAISYAESVLAFVKHYKLATIVGQPSAGTNGNVNDISLPNGFKTRFTGMKVTNLDGSQHFGVGVVPNVYVEKTIEGILDGRDEYLEKAIEIINTRNYK